MQTTDMYMHIAHILQGPQTKFGTNDQKSMPWVPIALKKTEFIVHARLSGLGRFNLFSDVPKVKNFVYSTPHLLVWFISYES